MSTVPVSASDSSVQAAKWQWFVWTAIAGSLASVIHFGSTLFVPIFLRPDLSTMRDTEAILSSVFTSMVIFDTLYGLCFGTVFGVALAIAWEPLVIPTAHGASLRTRAVLLGAIAGGIITWLSNSLVGWYIARSAWLIGVYGFGGGVISGIAQAIVLWKHMRAQLEWICLHGLTFAAAFVVLMSAFQDVSNMVLLPLVWFSLWGVYGSMMRYTFERLAYNWSSPGLMVLPHLACRVRYTSWSRSTISVLCLENIHVASSHTDPFTWLSHY